MTSIRRQQLLRALNEAKATIDKGDVPQTSLSKLNTLRGVERSEVQREGNLLSRTRSRQRPSFDLIADAILGNDSEHKSHLELISKKEFSEVVNMGMSRLRTSSESSAEITDSTHLGLAIDGRPIWSTILDNERGLGDSLFTTGEKIPAAELPSWPPTLKSSSHLTFQTWNTVPENSRAVQAVEKIIDYPAGTVNPLLIVGERGVGRSHLLNATAQAMLYRDLGHVVLLHVSQLDQENPLPDTWREVIEHCSLLAIDDLHLAEVGLATELGMMIDLALNLGLQVVATSRTDPELWETTRLWELMKGATTTVITSPSRASLVTHLRRSCNMRSILLKDEAIAAIATFSDGGWREVNSTFEQVALAVESGMDINDAADVRDILSESLIMEDIDVSLERMNIDDLAEGIVTNALDEVYTTQDGFGVELHADLPELNDEWEPEEFELPSGDKLLTRHLVQALTPHVSTTMEIDEAEKHLLHDDDSLTSLDMTRARETVSSIEQIADSAFEHLQAGHELNTVIIARLETELAILYQRSETANVDELIEISERIKGIEDELAELSPHKIVGIEADHDPKMILEKNRVLARLRPKRVMMPEAAV